MINDAGNQSSIFPCITVHTTVKGNTYKTNTNLFLHQKKALRIVNKKK